MKKELDNVREAWNIMSRVLPDEKKDHWVDLNGEALKNSLFEEIAEFVKSFILKGSSSPKILEVGCGTGRITNILSKNDDMDLIGIDFSEEQISIANSNKKNANIHFMVSDIVEYSIRCKDKENFFDVLFCHGVTQYFPSDEYFDNFIDISLNLVKTEGSILLIDAPITWYKEHMRGNKNTSLKGGIKILLKKIFIFIFGEVLWKNLRNTFKKEMMVEKLGDLEIKMPRFEGYWIDLERLQNRIEKSGFEIQLMYQPFKSKPYTYKMFRPIIRIYKKEI